MTFLDNVKSANTCEKCKQAIKHLIDEYDKVIDIPKKISNSSIIYYIYIYIYSDAFHFAIHFFSVFFLTTMQRIRIQCNL